MIVQIETTTGPAYQTEARGVSYYLRTDGIGRIEVTSQRNALRGARMGGTVRHFNTINEAETTIKAFAGLSDLMTATAVN